MPSYLGALRPLLLLIIVGYSVAADLNNYAEFQVDDDISSISTSPPDDGPGYNSLAGPASGFADEKPVNPWEQTSTVYPIDGSLGSAVAIGCQAYGNPKSNRKRRARRDIPMCPSNYLLPPTPNKVTAPAGQQPDIGSGDKKSPIPEPSPDLNLKMPVLLEPQDDKRCYSEHFPIELCSRLVDAIKVTYGSIFWKLPVCHPRT